MRSSVLLPEPLVPSTATISPASTAKSMPASAGGAVKLFAERVDLEHCRHDRMSCQASARRPAIASAMSVSLPSIANRRMAAMISRRPPGLLAVDQQKAEPLARAHDLGGDDEHPAEPEPAAQPGDIGRQRRRDQDAPDQPPGREAVDAPDLDEAAVDRLDAGHQVEIDREEHADRDQRDLRRLEDAEPQDEQRHPRDRRDAAQRLQHRVEQPPPQRRIAGQRAEHGRRRGADRETRTARAAA